VDYALLLRERDGSARVEHDRHVEGLFSTAEWLGAMEEAGFEEVECVPWEHSELPGVGLVVFVGKRRVS
jgi:hypothetical protein